MKQYLIGTDIGTSGTKSVLVDLTGKVLAEALEEYAILTPNPLWAEQWPDVWEAAAKKTIRDVITRSGIDPAGIGGMCISGLYGGSGIPLDADMKPVRPCIIWMDRRAQEECDWVRASVGLDRMFAVTGNGIDPYFGYTKILWIKHNEPENWEKTHLFLPPNDYVIYKLTGEILIDDTSAGNLGGIYDMHGHCWSAELMEALGIPEEMMPDRILSPDDIAGYVTEAAAEELGIPQGIPVCAGCIDCLASTIATGALYPGQHVAVIGTSINWGVLHTGFPTNKSYITMPYAKDPKEIYYTYGGASTAGALPKWFKENFAKYIMGSDGVIESDYDALNAKAEGVALGSDGLIVLPYFMGERSPIWDPNARGTIFGLTLHHTQAHVYRAFLEAVAYSLRHIMETSEVRLDSDSRCILVGGVTRSALWKQIFADVTGVPILCSRDNVEAPLGDALIAGVGTGLLPGYEVIRDWVHFDETIYPDGDNHRLYSLYYQQYKELYISLKSNMKSIASLNRSE